MKIFYLAFFLFLSIAMQISSFKQSQLEYERVRNANDRIAENIDLLLNSNKIGEHPFDLYFRAFKEEGELELWTRKKGRSGFQLMKSYVICAKSGSIGPKRKQGDLQVPEGFYHISRFNPMSKYHLSLGVNYPNPSDLERSDIQKPGGDIFIHGNCVTIGCLPMTDNHVEEIYLLCVEARDRGAGNIPITFFPCRIDPDKYSELMCDPLYSKDVKELWSSLKSAYDYFNTEKKLPSVRFLANGSHHIGE